MRASTDLPPSCLAHPPAHPDHLILGSYFLDPTTKQKSGSLALWTTSLLTAVFTLPTAAILDLKFSPHSPTTFAASTHDGRIQLYHLTYNDANQPIGFEPHGDGWDVRPEGVAGDRGVVTYVSWHPAAAAKIAFTLTSGDIGVLEVETGTVDGCGRLHDLEAWLVEWSVDGRALYSGGDDAALVKTVDGLQVWKDRRTHAAGVTAIVPRGEGLVTGSYDESMRVWDDRGGRGRVVQEVGIGGGVWRVVEGLGGWVVAGMHAGPKVVREEGGELGVVKEWGAMNLCYGVAMHPEAEKRVGWCSFYDKVVCVEDVEI